jgi:predicted AAA+ superfamily ATPase
VILKFFLNLFFRVDYITLDDPQYAVLLKGKWGSGKTHYIDSYKKNLDKKSKKYIYVSLYGITSYDEIETNFLKAIHPKLYNDKTIFAGKIVMS